MRAPAYRATDIVQVEQHRTWDRCPDQIAERTGLPLHTVLGIIARQDTLAALVDVTTVDVHNVHRKGRIGRRPLPCGTEAAYKRHQRQNTKPCEACTTASAKAKRLRKRVAS